KWHECRALARRRTLAEEGPAEPDADRRIVMDQPLVPHDHPRRPEAPGGRRVRLHRRAGVLRAVGAETRIPLVFLGRNATRPCRGHDAEVLLYPEGEPVLAPIG